MPLMSRKRRSASTPAPAPVAPPPPPKLPPVTDLRWTARYLSAFPGTPTYRELCRGDFLYGKTDRARFGGMRNWLFMTWPSRFLHEVRPGPDLPLFVYNEGYNPWLERHLLAFTNEQYAVRQGDSVFRFIGLTGAGSCGKTHSSALYALAWWAMDPENSIVVLTSTTKDMIRSRVWSVIQDYASTAWDACYNEPAELGHLVPSQMKLLSPSKSAKHSISAYAVAHGETLKAIDNLKGLHAKRMLVVIDEANGTPEAIFQVLPNYRKGCLDLTVIVIGNPVSRLDPHGRALKPADGWALAADENIIEWRSEGVPDWQVDSGLVLRFDGRDSPNVKRGYNRHPYLYTLDNWKQAQSKATTTGGTFAYWSFERGMWPPEGASNVIFTEQLFLRCDAIGTHFEWEATKEPVAFLDSAFGGDSCMFKWGFMGMCKGKMCLQIMGELDVPIDPAAAEHDIDYQVARRVRQECIVRNVKPYCFGVDATGIGRGVAAILAAEWSPQIQYTQWGGSATERASAQNDGRPAREVFANFVTELWMSVREGLEAGQIRGFTNDDVTQFCSRLYSMQGKKYKAEPKDEMRLRIRYSPDRADAIAGLWEVCRRNGLEVTGALAVQAQRVQTQAAKAFDGMIEGGDAHASGGWAEDEESGSGVLVAAPAWEDA